MKRRKHDEDLEADTRDEPSCCFCKYEGPGEVYDYWAGFCVDYKRTRAFLSSTVHIRAKYRDLRKYHVFVCDVCAGRMRLQIQNQQPCQQPCIPDRQRQIQDSNIIPQRQPHFMCREIPRSHSRANLFQHSG